MRLSVIVSTYNQPVWLEKVLRGYAEQTHPDFELLIADDGSGPETAEVLRGAGERTRLNLRHVWHEDRGYRRSVVLNRAIVAARGEYLIFSDGDCIPRRDFVARHAALARRGRFVSGGVIWLDRATSERITPAEIESGAFATPRWLRAQGWRPGRRTLRLLRSERVAGLLDALTPTGATWNLCNAGAWRADVLAVNGMDNAMPYGGADRALGERLTNAGVRGIQARHRLVLVHLDHGRPYKNDLALRRNRENRAAIRRERRSRSPDGIAELQSDPSLRINGKPLYQHTV
jgi:glycosyltransferase involved in cell wall biosynthesis